MAGVNRWAGVSLAALAVSAAGVTAQAQQAGQTSPTAEDRNTRGSNAGQIQEVVVTARKREERLQDVPVPISAFNSAALTARAAANLTAISDSIPNVKLEQVGLFPNAAAFTMRGIGTAGIESFQDPRVAIYINGAYQTRTASGPGDLFDVDSVEVLRGPQGALYGRNAFAGAIALRTRRPGDKFGGRFEANVGNYGRLDFQGAVDIPIVSDKLDLRLAYMHREFDGYATVGNPSALPTATVSTLVGRDFSKIIGQSAGGTVKDAYRGTLRFRPVEGVEANFIVTHAVTHGDSAAEINQKLVGSVFGVLGFPGRDPFGDYGRNISGDGSNPFITGSNYGNKDSEHGIDLLADLSVDILGGRWYTVVDYNRNQSLIITDTDGELADLFSSTRPERFAQFQVESRYQRKFFNNRVDLLTGIFYLRDNFDVFQRLQLGFGAAGNPALDPPLAPTPPFQFATDGRSSANQMQHDGQTRKSVSPYFQVNGNITDQLRLNLALRYSKEWRDGFDYPLQTPVGPAGAAALSNDFDVLDTQLKLATSCGSAKFSADSLSPTIGLDYKAKPNILVFASWQRAFKSGGLNVNGTCGSFAQPYQDEQVDNYEAGIKSELFERRLRINMNAFRSDYSNLQESVIRVNPNNPAAADTFTSNAAGATIYGVEAEITVNPIRNLTLFANVGWLHPEYTAFCANLAGTTTFTGPAPTSDCGGAVTVLRQPTLTAPGQALVDLNHSDLKLPFAPEWDTQVGGRYRYDAGRYGFITVESSVHYDSDLQTSVQNQPFTDRAPLTKVDASVAWQDPHLRYRIALWGRNLNDDIGRLSAVYVAPLFIFASPTEPRTWGATVTADF